MGRNGVVILAVLFIGLFALLAGYVGGKVMAKYQANPDDVYVNVAP